MWHSFFYKSFKKPELTSVFDCIQLLMHLKRNWNAITYVICVALQFEVAWCGMVSAITKALRENCRTPILHVGAINFHGNLGTKAVYPCSVYCAKPKIPPPRIFQWNFLCSKQRCTVLIKLSFSVYLGIHALPALAKTQY